MFSLIAILFGFVASAEFAEAQTFVSGNYACRSPWKFRTESYVQYTTHHYLEPPAGSIYNWWPVDPNGYFYYKFTKSWPYSAPGSEFWWVGVTGADPAGLSAYGKVVCWQ